LRPHYLECRKTALTHPSFRPDRLIIADAGLRMPLLPAPSSHQGDAEAGRFVTFAYSRRETTAAVRRVATSRLPNPSARTPGEPNDIAVRGSSPLQYCAHSRRFWNKSPTPIRGFNFVAESVRRDARWIYRSHGFRRVPDVGQPCPNWADLSEVNDFIATQIADCERIRYWL
jgi:hypothetical protein